MTAPVTAVQRLQPSEVPGLFTGDVSTFKKVTDLGKAIIQALGVMFGALSAGLKALGDTFKGASTYFGATKVLSSFPKLFDLKTVGDSCAKFVNNLALFFVDAYAIPKFLDQIKVINLAQASERMGQIPVIGPLFGAEFNLLVGGVGLVGSAAGVVDVGVGIKKTLDIVHQHGMQFNFMSGVLGKGWFAVQDEAPATAAAKKQVDKNVNEIGSKLHTIAIMTTYVVLNMLSLAIHPFTVFLGLYIAADGFAQVLTKGSDNAKVAHDPSLAAAWQVAHTLPLKA